MKLDLEDDSRDFQRDGAICMRGIVDPQATVRLFDEAERAETAAKDYRANMGLADRLASYWDCVGPLPEIAAALTGSDQVRFYNDHLFVKKSGASTVWHQDLPFWPFRSERIIAAWIALTSVRREASALQYIRGSHRRGSFYRPDPRPMADPTHPDYLALELCPDYFDPELREPEEFLTWDMEPGDVLWHHPLVVHGAYPNNSPDNPVRAGLTVRFLGDDVRWDPRPYLHNSTRTPTVAPGEPLVDDGAFPLIWSSAKGLVSPVTAFADLEQ